jgi:hypothetical protein
MLTISRPLSAGQTRRYHEEEFENARENYYTAGDRIRAECQGQLAAKWGLIGEVRKEHHRRLADGQHPLTGEQIVRHQTARAYTNTRGETASRWRTALAGMAPSPSPRARPWCAGMHACARRIERA